MKFLIVAAIFSMAACSNRQVYDSIQANRTNECNTLSGVQREKCLESLAPDYNTYQKQRQELLKKQPK